MEEAFKNLNNGDIFIRISRDIEKDPKSKKEYHKVFVLKLHQKVRVGSKTGNTKEEDSYICESRCYFRERELPEREWKWKYARNFSTPRPYRFDINDLLYNFVCSGIINHISTNYLYFIVKDEEDILWNNAENNLPFVDSNNLVDFEDIKLFMKQFMKDIVFEACLFSA